MPSRARQLFFGRQAGRLGELRDRAFEDQMHRASCLHLIMAAIAACLEYRLSYQSD